MFSCVLQRTALVQLMLLLYINNIGENITSHIKLFTDDCLLFRTIDSVADTVALQNYLCSGQLTVSLTQLLLKVISVKCYSGPGNGK